MVAVSFGRRIGRRRKMKMKMKIVVVASLDGSGPDTVFGSGSSSLECATGADGIFPPPCPHHPLLPLLPR